MRRVVAFGLCLSLVGCTAWPRPASVASPELAATPIRTIDLLPLDLEVWTYTGSEAKPDVVRVAAETRIVDATTDGIQRQGYAVNARLGWAGDYAAAGGAPASALEPADMLATLDSLASYGGALAAKPVAGELPFPYLPVRLGERTGADASLYIGGWGYVGKEPDRAGTVAMVVIGVVLIVVVIAIVVASAKSGGDGKVLDGIGSAGRNVAHVAASVGRAAAKTTLQATTFVLENPDVAVDVIDAFGHTSTRGPRPEYAQDKALPHDGKPELYLEMTLVDNRTGVALWHAHQRFPANAARADQVTRAARALIATLPRSVRQAVATAR